MIDDPCRQSKKFQRSRLVVRGVATVGVYGSTLEQFLDALRAADVEQVLDVRQRRGVRGPQYAWANSRRLQDVLAGTGIEYRHHRELAPTTELRHLQYAADDRLGVGKRSRVELAPEYATRYVREILGPVDLAPIVAAMPAGATAALLCVERDPEACHRSLIAERLADEFGLEVVHLLPTRGLPPQLQESPSRFSVGAGLARATRAERSRAFRRGDR